MIRDVAFTKDYTRKYNSTFSSVNATSPFNLYIRFIKIYYLIYIVINAFIPGIIFVPLKSSMLILIGIS